MKKYLIGTINADGYERFVEIEESNKNTKLVVHFLEFDEYLENDEKTRKKKRGDIIEGDISIELVTKSQKVNKELFYKQRIQDSSYIEAIVEVTQIIDEYSMYVLSSILDEKILVEFESAVDYKIGDRILIAGSLELKEREEI